MKTPKAESILFIVQNSELPVQILSSGPDRDLHAHVRDLHNIQIPTASSLGPDWDLFGPDRD